MEVHVVSKSNNRNHARFDLKPESPGQEVDLPASSVQVRPILISLTSNNLSYARAGSILHWWDTYPVPQAAPPPYNDNTAWGIVPAWGYAVVTKTAIPSMSTGTVLWGFWPTADMTVSLKLESGTTQGSWIEVSEHRQRLMTIYNLFNEAPEVSLSTSSQAPALGDEKVQDLAWRALFRATWPTGYLISAHVFAPKLQDKERVHPTGTAQAWTTEDADLSGAVLVSLAASGKTARAFAYQILRRPSSSGPLGLLEVTASPALISEVSSKLESQISSKAIAYSDLEESLHWMVGLKPSKVVIVDFGARQGSTEKLVDLVKGNSYLHSSKLTVLQVGSEQKVYTAREMQTRVQAMTEFGKIQFNASGVRDAVIKSIGNEILEDRIKKAWEDWLRVSHSLMPDMQVSIGKGVSGVGGIEGAWERLCRSEVGAQEGLVYKLGFLNN